MNAKNAKTKAEKAAEKFAEKKAKAKTKRVKLKGFAAVAFLAVLVGCASSEPASRVSRTEYGDIIVSIEKSSSNTVNVTIGDGVYSSADSKGSTETTTATPTNTTDIRPDVDVNTTGGRTAGVLETAINAGAAWLNSSSKTDSSAATTDSSCSSACADGSCENGACTECTAK